MNKFLDLILASTKDTPRYFIPQPDGKSPYLERLVLEDKKDASGKSLSKTYLHIIYAGDGDRDPHDHPYDFKSTIVFGSYIEHNYDFEPCQAIAKHLAKLLSNDLEHTWKDNVCVRCNKHQKDVPLVETTQTYSVGDKNFKKAHQLHRLELTGPVVALVKRGPKYRQWGFQTADGWEAAPSYISRKFPNADVVDVD